MIPYFFMQRRQKQMDEALKKMETLSVVKQNGNDAYDVDPMYKKQAALEGLMDKWTVCIAGFFSSCYVNTRFWPFTATYCS